MRRAFGRIAGFAWVILGLLAWAAAPADADEGMWLFSDPPRKTLEAKYGFDPTDAWLEHLRRSSVRFNSGGSGSFVSADGLVMTNHHVGADALQKLGTKDRDYVRTGFHARSRDAELKCVDLELNVLVSSEDVTARVNAAVKPGSSPAEAHRTRRAVMNTIEKESLEKTGLRSDVVTLYGGGMYHLYRYKKYTDVRLVFAPEQSIAFFGGDVDNFEYPRYDLDICFFRVYEDGKPARVADHLAWSPAGVTDGELVFVSGHPGHTDRLDTMAQLEFLRDRAMPQRLATLFRREVLLSTFSQRSEENARRAQDELFGIQNSRKASLGRMAALQDPEVMGCKRTEEQAFRDAVRGRPEVAKIAAGAWDEVAASIRAMAGIYDRFYLLEEGGAFNSDLFHIAKTLVRLAEETAKPNADRLREYRESNLESLRLWLFSEAPIYDDFETVKLADSLGMFEEMAGAEGELFRRVMAGKSPRDRAFGLIEGTRLKDVAVRKSLAEGGMKAIESSDDPMIRLARLVDPEARRLRTIYEEQVEEPQRQAHARLADARFALYGRGTYPDATFTLRLAFGQVKGYTELGRTIPPWTTIEGLYRHAAEHGNRRPFELDRRWLEAKDRLDPAAPMNFVSTVDIIGGNSGSPVVNRKGELAGIIFDGNLDSLGWGFVYAAQTGRAIAVDSRAIVEALRRVYHADTLADELAGKTKEVPNVRTEAEAFLNHYQRKFAELEIPANLAGWKAANSGKKEDFDAAARASLAVRTFHRDAAAYRRVRELAQSADRLTPLDARALRVAEIAYQSNQLPADLLKRMVDLSTEIERLFNTHRAALGGKGFTNNDLLEMLRKENDSRRREEIWIALKQVGGVVAPKLLELARLRNEAARRLGFANFWEMQIRFQEHDPEKLLAIFDELERLTREPFAECKAEMDRELAARFGVEAGRLMPWHYDNPFFQAAPPSDKVRFDEFCAGKSKEDIVEIARKFYRDVGLPVDDVLARSDLYEREGKSQHAFCTSIDRAGDVRTLCNVKPTAEWMDTTLHELGHAAYDLGIDRALPFNLREPPQAFTTEGVAMLFGALGKNPAWMAAYAGADKARLDELAGAMREQRRREQLVFARWTLVMLHFEKALYENPEQDLSALWWNFVERFQRLRRPADRDAPDWAAKPHFTIAPVYYHGYMLGELFAAQLRHALAGVAGGSEPASQLGSLGRKEVGEFLGKRVFFPGNIMPWPEFVVRAAGEPLTPRYFADEVKRKP